MKRIYYYFAVLAVVCFATISAWVYVKYIRSSESSVLTYAVQMGTISEVVKSRGELTAEHDLLLGFPASGRVQHVYVAEGASVKAGTLLMTLDSAGEQAQLAQMRANLAKLLAGATSADIAVSQAQAAAASAAVYTAKIALVNAIESAYTASDDAVTNSVDQFITGPRSTAPIILSTLPVQDTLKEEIQQKRIVIGILLTSWGASTSQLTAGSSIDSAISEARGNLDQVKAFLDRVAFMINSTFATTNLTQTTIDGYKAGVSAARTAVTAAITTLATTEGTYRTAQSNLAVAENQLTLKQSPPRQEDIAATQAQIAETAQAVANASLRAPIAGRIVKIAVLQGEQFTPGTTAITMNSPTLKVISDISELNIGKIRSDSGRVEIGLDAFPGELYSGKVVSVEPQEINKEGDKYYRVNIAFDQVPPDARSGMSADLNIIIQTKPDVLLLPEFLVYTREDKKFVQLMFNGTATEREVTVGISNGEQVEILTGLSEGDIVTTSPE